MYKAFDSFLAVDTWHTGHPSDGQRFYAALATVVRDPNFNADAMGAYIREKVRNSELSYSVGRLVTQGWAVREFLESTGEVQRP